MKVTQRKTNNYISHTLHSYFDLTGDRYGNFID